MDVDQVAIMRVIGGKSYLKRASVVCNALLCNYNMPLRSYRVENINVEYVRNYMEFLIKYIYQSPEIVFFFFFLFARKLIVEFKMILFL